MGGARQVFPLSHQVEDILVVFGFIASEDGLEIFIGILENFFPKYRQLLDKPLR